MLVTCGGVALCNYIMYGELGAGHRHVNVAERLTHRQGPSNHVISVTNVPAPAASATTATNKCVCSEPRTSRHAPQCQHPGGCPDTNKLVCRIRWGGEPRQQLPPDALCPTQMNHTTSPSHLIAAQHSMAPPPPPPAPPPAARFPKVGFRSQCVLRRRPPSTLTPRRYPAAR